MYSSPLVNETKYFFKMKKSCHENLETFWSKKINTLIFENSNKYHIKITLPLYHRAQTSTKLNKLKPRNSPKIKFKINLIRQGHQIRKNFWDKWNHFLNAHFPNNCYVFLSISNHFFQFFIFTVTDVSELIITLFLVFVIFYQFYHILQLYVFSQTLYYLFRYDN